MIYRMNPDHLPHFRRLSGDALLPCYTIDVANGLTWTGSQWMVPVEVALENIDTIRLRDMDVPIPVMRVEFQFLFTILHLFREAWFTRSMESGLDVTLAKFGDVARLWIHCGPAIMRAEFSALIRTLGIVRPVLWILEHLDRTFHMTTVASLGLAGMSDEEWLASARAPGGQAIKADGTMRQRLVARDRMKLFHEA